MKVFAAVSLAAVVGSVSLGLVAAAEVTETADRADRRFQVSPTPAPPSAREECNYRIYVAYDAYPVVGCYRAVAAEQGWTTAKIDAWQSFLVTEFSSVTQGESSQCWNLRGGDRISAGQPCTAVQRTRYPTDDTGWGQATRSLWGPTAHLCVAFGVCSAQQIIESPYSSMLNSVIRVVDYAGSRPWCWAAWAREYHDCWEAPDR